MDDEGVLDPWVAQWLNDNPYISAPMTELLPEVLEMGRSPVGAPPSRDISSVTDETVEGIRVRIYSNEVPPTGVVVYFHGGGFVIGSIGLMDNVARELAYGSGAVVVSVEYRLAPEHPYPAGLDDCETVTRWALANANRFGVPPSALAIAGESAGGNLSAALALRFRESGDVPLAAQALIYPAVSGSREDFASRSLFDGVVLNRATTALYWSAYCGGRDLSDDPYAAPLSAKDLEGLPPALVVLGGCDVLRDEGRAYAKRLAADGVDVQEVCYPGQPHGFMNLPFPAAGPAFELVGDWLRTKLSAAGSS